MVKRKDTLQRYKGVFFNVGNEIQKGTRKKDIFRFPVLLFATNFSERSFKFEYISLLINLDYMYQEFFFYLTCGFL